MKSLDKVLKNDFIEKIQSETENNLEWLKSTVIKCSDIDNELQSISRNVSYFRKGIPIYFLKKGILFNNTYISSQLFLSLVSLKIRVDDNTVNRLLDKSIRCTDELDRSGLRAVNLDDGTYYTGVTKNLNGVENIHIFTKSKYGVLPYSYVNDIRSELINLQLQNKHAV